MDANVVSQLISTVGFPIAACCVCFWYMNAERKSHEEEITNLSKVINDNTLTLQKLSDVIASIKSGTAQ